RRFDVVLRHTLSVRIHVAQVVLRANEPLTSSQAIPAHRFGVILRHALAASVDIAEVILRVRKSLIGSLAIPAHRFGVVPRNAWTILVDQTKIVLCDRLPSSGKSSQLFQRLRVSRNRRPVKFRHIPLRFGLRLLRPYRQRQHQSQTQHHRSQSHPRPLFHKVTQERPYRFLVPKRWATGQLERLDNPPPELLDLVTDGPERCLKRPAYDFRARPESLNYIQQFAPRATRTRLASDASVHKFAEWAARNLEMPLASFGYSID